MLTNIELGYLTDWIGSEKSDLPTLGRIVRCSNIIDWNNFI